MKNNILPSTLAERVKFSRIARDWSQATLAKKSGLSQRVVSKIEGGESKNPSSDTIFKLAYALETTASWLLTGIEASEQLAAGAPIIDWKLAMLGKDAVKSLLRGNNYKRLPALPGTPPECFWLRMQDNSMSIPNLKDSIEQGAYILVDPIRTSPSVGVNLIIARDKADLAICRKLIYDDEKFFLVSLNPLWRPIELDKTVKIVGTVIGVLYSYIVL